MIFDSVKSAEPTAIDFRSPDISPPPSGLKLPHAGSITVISPNTAARTARLRLRAIDIRKVLPERWLPRTLSRRARRRRALTHRERRGGFIRLPKGQDGAMTSDPSLPSEPLPALPPAEPVVQPSQSDPVVPPESAVKFTRAAALWSALIVGFVILILLLVFIMQNTDST